MSLTTLLCQLLQEDLTITDVHVESEEGIWLRKEGEMVKLDKTAVAKQDIVELLNSLSVAKDWESKLHIKGDLDLSFKLGQTNVRCNAYLLKRRQLGLAIRKLNDTIPEADTLGLPQTLIDLTNKSKGLILITGATGMGKTTTLAALVNGLNHRKNAHVITLEDPIEYIFNNAKSKIDQREIGQTKDVCDFPTALRAALRQDPDILVIGEMRDKETIQTAITAAETGHLVLATLHTINAKQSLERIISVFPGEEKTWISYTLSSVLLGILSQVLIERKDGRGKVLAHELLINTSNVKQAIKDNKFNQISGMMETGSGMGQCLLNKSLATLVLSDQISVADATFYTYDIKGLEGEI